MEEGRRASFPLWRYRWLVLQLARRDVERRFRDSIFGWVWVVGSPLVALSIYVLVFDLIFQAKGDNTHAKKVSYSVFLFTGLIVFNFFQDVVARSPSLLLEQPSLIKKVVFPVDVLPVTNVLSAGFNLSVGVALLVVLHLVFHGWPPPTFALLPIILMPLAAGLIGLSYALASLSLFARDLRQFVPAVLPLFVFVSPVFYSVSAIPEGYRDYIYLNPLVVPIEQMRQVCLWGESPDWATWAISLVGGLATLLAGRVVFRRLQREFADVV